MPLRFPGDPPTSNDLTLASALSFTTFQSALTVSAWVRTALAPAAGNRQGIFCVGDTVESVAFDFYLTTNNKPAVWMSKDDDAQYGFNEALTNLAADTWYHILWQRVAWENYQWYVNGVEDEDYQDFSATTDDDLLGSVNRMSIGGLTAVGINSTFGFNGDIADICVFDTVLSTASISQLASGVDPRSIAGAGLRYFWPLFNKTASNYGSVGNQNVAWVDSGGGSISSAMPPVYRPTTLSLGVPASATTHEESGSLGASLGLSATEILTTSQAGTLGASLGFEAETDGALGGVGLFGLDVNYIGDSITQYVPDGTLGLTLNQLATGSLGVVYYALDPTGGNDGTGAASDSQATAESTPWQTWNALEAALVEPTTGDARIIVKRGETVSGQCTLTKDGLNIDARIVIGAYGSGASPIFDGQTETWALRVRNWTHVTNEVEITSTAGDEDRKAISIPNNHGEGILIECDIDGAAGVQIIDSGTSAGVTIQNNEIITSDGDCISILSNTAGTVTMQDLTGRSNGGVNADVWQVANAATCPVVCRRMHLWQNHVEKQAVTIGGAISSLVCEELDFHTTITSGTRPDGFIIRNGGGPVTLKGFRFRDEYEICVRLTDEVGGLAGNFLLQGAYLLQREGSTSPCLRVDEDSSKRHGTFDVVLSNITIPQGNNIFYVAVDTATPDFTLRYENCIFHQTSTTGGGYVMRLGGAGSLLPNLSSSCNNNILRGATHVSGTYILSNSTEHTTLSGHQAEFAIQGIDDASADEQILFRDAGNDDYTPDSVSAAYQGGKAVGGGSVYWDLTTVVDPENIGSHPGGWAFVHEQAAALGLDKALGSSSTLDAEVAAALALSEDLTGANEVSAEVAGTLSVSSGLAGESLAALNVAGDLDVSQGLSGLAAAIVAADGTLPITANLIGAGGAAISASGLLSVTLDLAGLQDGSITSAGTLGLQLDQVASGEVATAAAGTLSVSLELAGSRVRVLEGAGLLGGTFDVSGLAALALVDASGALSLNIDLASSDTLDAETGASLGLTLSLASTAEQFGLMDGLGTFALDLTASTQALAIYEAAADIAAQLNADAVSALITDQSGTLAAQLGLDSSAGLDILDSGVFQLECDLFAAEDSAIGLSGTLGLQIAATAGAIASYAPGGNLALGLDLIGSVAGPLGAAGTLGLSVGESATGGLVTEENATLTLEVDMTASGAKFSTTIETADRRRIVIRSVGRQIIIRGGSFSD